MLIKMEYILKYIWINVRFYFLIEAERLSNKYKVYKIKSQLKKYNDYINGLAILTAKNKFNKEGQNNGE